MNVGKVEELSVLFIITSVTCKANKLYVLEGLRWS